MNDSVRQEIWYIWVKFNVFANQIEDAAATYPEFEYKVINKPQENHIKGVREYLEKALRAKTLPDVRRYLTMALNHISVLSMTISDAYGHLWGEQYESIVNERDRLHKLIENKINELDKSK
jgi:hypothetical protein